MLVKEECSFLFVPCVFMVIKLQQLHVNTSAASLGEAKQETLCNFQQKVHALMDNWHGQTDGIGNYFSRYYLIIWWVYMQ